MFVFCVASRRRHTRCALVTGVQTCALPIFTEIENTGIAMDEPTPERVVAARRELERVQRLIEELPDRCRRIFELRKVDGLSQREVAEQLGVTEFVIGNEVAEGMKLILQSIADGDRKIGRASCRERVCQYV